MGIMGLVFVYWHHDYCLSVLRRMFFNERAAAVQVAPSRIPYLDEFLSVLYRLPATGEGSGILQERAKLYCGM